SESPPVSRWSRSARLVRTRRAPPSCTAWSWMRSANARAFSCAPRYTTLRSVIRTSPGAPAETFTAPNAFSTSTGVLAATTSVCCASKVKDGPWKWPPVNQPQAPGPKWLRMRQAVSTVDPKARMTSSSPIFAPFISGPPRVAPEGERDQLEHAPDDQAERPPGAQRGQEVDASGVSEQPGHAHG